LVKVWWVWCELVGGHGECAQMQMQFIEMSVLEGQVVYDCMGVYYGPSISRLRSTKTALAHVYVL